MKIKLIASFLLLSLGCTTVDIPREKTVWAQSVDQQITEATVSHYVYIPVADREEMNIVEYLAFKRGKQTQRIKQNGKITECVFVFPY